MIDPNQPSPIAAAVIQPPPPPAPDASGLGGPNPTLPPAAQPNVQGPSGMGGETQQQNPRAQASQPATVTVPAHQAQQIAQHAAGWQGFKSLVGGFAPPGSSPARQLFGNILSGAIAGMGAQTVPGQGWANAGRGAAAAQQAQQRQQQQAQAQTQQQFQNQIETNKDKREQQVLDANMAQMQAQTARWRHEDDLHDQEAHDTHNKASQALLSSFTAPEVGGRAPVDGSLPGTISATDFAKTYMANPKVRQSSNPDYVRHFIDTTDASEVTWNDTANGGKGGWVNQTDGEPANMTDHTMIHVVDVPRANMLTRNPTSGKELNDLSHLPKGVKLYDDDQTYPVSQLDKIAIYKKGLDDRLEQTKVDVDNRRVAANETANQREAERQKQEELAGFERTIAETNKNLGDAVKEETDPVKQATIRQQIAANDAELAARRDELYPSKKSKGGAPPPAGSLPPPAAVDPVQKLKDDTLSATPPNLTSVVGLYINGGSAGGKIVPPATNLRDALDRLDQNQQNPTPGARLSSPDYAKTVTLLKDHYNKLQPLKQDQAKKIAEDDKENRYQRLHAIDSFITKQNMNDFDDNGVYIRTGSMMQ